VTEKTGNPPHTAGPLRRRIESDDTDIEQGKPARNKLFIITNLKGQGKRKRNGVRSRDEKTEDIKQSTEEKPEKRRLVQKRHKREGLARGTQGAWGD